MQKRLILPMDEYQLFSQDLESSCTLIKFFAYNPSDLQELLHLYLFYL
jgi:hypothetical protein